MVVYKQTAIKYYVYYIRSNGCDITTRQQNASNTGLKQQLDDAIAQVVRDDENDDLKNLQLKLILENQFDCGPNRTRVKRWVLGTGTHTNFKEKRSLRRLDVFFKR